jgi:hypothetical protein
MYSARFAYSCRLLFGLSKSLFPPDFIKFHAHLETATRQPVPHILIDYFVQKAAVLFVTRHFTIIKKCFKMRANTDRRHAIDMYMQ